MAEQQTAIAALERVLLTVESELSELHAKTILEAAASPPPPPPPPPQPPQAAPLAPGAPPQSPAPQPPAASQPASFGFEQLLRFGGAGLVILAAIFFVSTAISRGWIGPEAQLLLATTISVSLIGVSFRIRRDRKPWRAALAITGTSALLATGVVGHLGLELLGATTTLGWMALSVLGFIGLGSAHDSESVAFTGGPAALIAALLMFEAGATPSAVLIVAMLFGGSVLAATWDKSWFGARAAGGTAVAAVTLMAAADEPLTQMTSLALPAAVLVVISLAASQLFDWCSGKDISGFAAIVEARLAAATTPWAVLVLSIMIAGDRVLLVDYANTIGWFALIVGVAVGGLVTATHSRLHPTMATLHQVSALGVISVGLVTVLEGPALMTALLVQAMVAGVLAYKTKSPGAIIIATIVGGVSVLWNGIEIMLAFLDEPMAIGEIAATGLFVLSASAGAWLLRGQPAMSRLWKGAWALHLIWVAAALQAAPQPQMWISLAWAASSIALVAGRHRLWGPSSTHASGNVLNVALATLLITGGKLIFVDLVAVDVLWRAALFFLIGGTFLRLGFILPKLRQEPDRVGAKEPDAPSEARVEETSGLGPGF